MSLDNFIFIPAGSRNAYKHDRGCTWINYKSPRQMPAGQMTPHQVFLAHQGLDEQYVFQDAAEARWFFVQGYKGSLFEDDKTLLPFDRMTLWIDGVEVGSRSYEPTGTEKPSVQSAEEPPTTTAANAAAITTPVVKTADTKCLNGCCGSGKPAAQLEVMGFAEGKPVIAEGYCSERCYREAQGEYCSDIFRKFMDRVVPVGDDVGFYVVYDRPDGGHDHLPATFQPGIVDSASRGYRPVGVFGSDSKGNLLDQQCFYLTRVGDEAIIADEIAKQKLEHLNRETSLNGIEDLN